jgi:hypothetical protein
MKNTRSFLAILLILTGFTTSCGVKEYEPSAEQKDRTATEKIMKDYGQTQPIPKMNRSQVRESLIEIQKLEGRATSTYSVERAMDGRVLRLFPSIGYPIPGGTSLTNPLQPTCGYSGSSGYACTAIGQAETTGVFIPATSEGTRIIEVTPDGSKVAFYSESKISTYAYPITQKDAYTVIAAGTPPANSRLNIDVNKTGEPIMAPKTAIPNPNPNQVPSTSAAPVTDTKTKNLFPKSK